MAQARANPHGVITPPSNLLLETFLTEHDIARILNVSIGTVRRWRLLRVGPTWVKLGWAVRYPPDRLRLFIASLPAQGVATREAQ
jgi:hypothetical protein